MRASISYGFGFENRYNLNSIPKNIQLAVYKSDQFWKNSKDIVSQLKDNDISVNVVHLPLDTLKQNMNEILIMIAYLRNNVDCRKFVIHPNKLVKNFITNFEKMYSERNDIILCIENFPWRKKKELRSPLEIIGFIESLPQQENLAMTFDTSHAEEIWFDDRVLSYMLPYISVIHLSNKIGRKQHLPFNISRGDLNLVGFVQKLKHRYHWDGDIVLEYMPEYHEKLFKNYQYLEKLIGD
jgi:putative NIF3 family GTP cyclohydrolase 1 type 2